MSIFKMTFENILYIKKERAFNEFFVVRQEFLFLMIPKNLSPQSRKESVLLKKKNYLFMYFCYTGSSLLHMGFLYLQRAEATL